MASVRWALCLAALLATTHLASAQITGSNAREALMRAREGGAGSQQSSTDSSGGRSSSGQGTANSFGTLGTVGGVAAGAATSGGLIGMGGSDNGNQNGGNNIGNLNGNSNGGGNLIGGNGNSNGNSNLGNKNGNGNGNQNGGLITGISGGTGSGNGNGNLNTGDKNGNGNGNGNVLGGNGNSNGNGNLGSSNGNSNGNGNLGSNNGNGNGNNNEGSSKNGNNNGNGNTGSGNGNNNGNGNSCAKTGKNTCGSGSNDPIMTGFTGRAFNFFGDVGKTYNLISSKNHQLSARLKLSVMSDHNGTTMDGVGFMYKAYRVLFELEGDTPHVYVNDKELSPRKKKQKHAWRFEDSSAVEMSWDPYTPGIGNAVVIASDVLKVMVWHTPKGIIDEGGKVLEGYVNFNITLMAPPEDDRMAGIIGDTYERFTVGQEAFNPNSTYFLPEDQAWHGKGPAEDYEMVNYWDTKFAMNMFGTNGDVLSSRSALETEPVVEVAEEADSRLGQPQQLRLRRLLLA